MRDFNWHACFQLLAFFLGWGASLASTHPVGAFLGTWALFAFLFAFLAWSIRNDSTKGKQPGPGSSPINVEKESHDD